MKLRLNYCCWLTLLFVGSNVISVSPNSSSTATTLNPNSNWTLGRQLPINTGNSFALSKTTPTQTTNKVKSFPKLLHTTLSPPPTEDQQPRTIETHPSMFRRADEVRWKGQPRRAVQNQRKPRNAEQNDDADGYDRCRTFTDGEDDTNTLYSPDYPNNYPKNINCTRIIEAPRGQLIRLDFRNSFNIEQKEECKFDYLEIRDGPYGFSNLIGRYCGEEFPPMITSKERHLWLHFHSDESIEYSGFTAVFEFIDRPKEAISTELNCTIEKGGFEGLINNTEIPIEVSSNVSRHKIPLDCMWVIRVQPDWKIQVKFLQFNLIKPNDCDMNFIDVFGEDTTIPSRVKNFCGSTGESLSSESNIIHIRFFAEAVAINSSFNILYTAFRDKGANCVDGEFDCEDATCISQDLVCNGRDNCKFRWDEDSEDCRHKEEGESEHVVLIMTVFGFILGGMIAVFLFNCARKLLRDQKIIREHIRQSRESKLDEMGRKSMEKRSRENSTKLSPSQKHSQTSLQILDDVSNRYYREIVPISVQTSKADVEAHSILRQHHDMVVQTSLGDDSPEGGVCDMGCQTRESLFQPVLRQKSINSSSPSQSAAAIRFSTFGYQEPPPPPPPSQKAHTLSRQSTKSRIPSECIELDDRHPQLHQHHLHHSSGPHADSPSRPQEMCHHHHQHQQHLQKQQHLSHDQQQHQHNQHQLQQHGHHHHHHTQLPTGKGKQKLDESKVFIDIRNSAPDVIIMTSH